MRTEYKRDMNHNYLILTGDERIDTDSYQVRMIVANAVPDLLQCRIQGIDGKFMVYYDITSRHSMTALFEEKKMDLESLQMILGGFIQIMEEMSEYLLNPCQLILEPEYIYLDAERKSVRIDIRDNGCGISKEQQAAIFQPFFTTKESGTGLGLAVSKQIAQAHSGDITLESTPGQGTVFHIFLG
jgi:light-regulated signal transduction histidine kinase (bacteriophytochrome)